MGSFMKKNIFHCFMKKTFFRGRGPGIRWINPDQLDQRDQLHNDITARVQMNFNAISTKFIFLALVCNNLFGNLRSNIISG